MANFGQGLGAPRYSLGDLYGGVTRDNPMKDYSQQDDTSAIIAALLASRQGLGMNIPPAINIAPRKPTAQVPVMASAGPRGYGTTMYTGAPEQGSQQRSASDNIKTIEDAYDKLSPSSGPTSGAAPGSGVAQPIDLAQTGSAGLGSIGAGAMFGTSGSAALGAAAPVATDAALANLGTISAGEMFGTSASAAAGAGPGSLGAAGGAGGLGSGTGAASGALAGSGIGTALPLAAIGWAAADAYNASGDKDSHQVSAWLDQIGARSMGKAGWYTLPDGKMIRADKGAEAAARAYFNRDSSYDSLYNDWLATGKARKP